jgi:hypothetical protein
MADWHLSCSIARLRKLSMKIRGALTRQLTSALRHPDYVLGRFYPVRRAYAYGRRAIDYFKFPASVRLSDKFERSVTYSGEPRGGTVESNRRISEHLYDLGHRSYSAGLTLPKHLVASIITAAESMPLSVDEQPAASWRRLANRDDVAIATVCGSSKIPEVQQIATDSLLVNVVERYLGYAARRVESWLYWSPASKLSQRERVSRHQTVEFHYDVHGYSFMYVNFYLLDTDESSGAHVLVPGTHNRKRLGHLLGPARLSDEAVAAAFGEGAAQTICGPSGFGFFEDPSCYHKALVPQVRDRLMLQFRYR